MSRAEPADRLSRFVEMSALLTGYGPVDLLGTGMADSYLQAMDAALPAGVPDELLDAFGQLPAGAQAPAAPGPGPGAAGAAGAVLDDAKLGPVARNVILMWYRGSWTAMPQPWRSAYGASPLDTDHVVSPAAYQVGLQWDAAGAHPAGARMQGFGAWASPPGALGAGSAQGAARVRVPRQAPAQEGASS
jgi:hypothetical protein